MREIIIIIIIIKKKKKKLTSNLTCKKKKGRHLNPGAELKHTILIGIIAKIKNKQARNDSNI